MFFCSFYLILYFHLCCRGSGELGRELDALRLAARERGGRLAEAHVVQAHVVQGLQALESGLVLVPSALILLVLMPVAGRLYDRFGPRWPVVVGLLIMAYGSFLMADITPDTPRVDLQLWTTIRNLGTGLAMMPIFTAGITALPPALTSAGSGMNNVMQRVASSIAVAIFGSAELDLTRHAPIDGAVLSRDPAVGEAYAADPLVWHGGWKRPTLEAFVAADRAEIAHAAEAFRALGASVEALEVDGSTVSFSVRWQGISAPTEAMISSTVLRSSPRFRTR